MIDLRSRIIVSAIAMMLVTNMVACGTPATDVAQPQPTATPTQAMPTATPTPQPSVSPTQPSSSEPEPTPTPVSLEDEWSLAYSTFYSGMPGYTAKDIKIEVDDNAVIRDETICPIYTVECPQGLTDMVVNKTMPAVYMYGVALNPSSDLLHREGIINLNGIIDQMSEGSDLSWFYSLQITSELSAQLKKSGLIPKYTKAYCFSTDPGIGIYFDDGTTQQFYLKGLTLFGEEGSVSANTLYALNDFIDKYQKDYIKQQEQLPNDIPIGGNPTTGKPVIYLYPEKQTDVTVKLDFGGELWYTYPTINDGGWNVTAYPDGRLVNKSDKTEHYYLFWDGNSDTQWRFDEGFCVAGVDMEAFLRQKLAYMGLTPREYNDFITYWVPKMKDNKYNLITFSGEQYEQLAPLTVSPAPDSVLRVHMVYKPLTERQTITEQKLKPFERKGFAMVEWGGSVAK